MHIVLSIIAALYVSLYLVKLPHLLHAATWVVATWKHLGNLDKDFAAAKAAGHWYPVPDVDSASSLRTTRNLLFLLMAVTLVPTVLVLLVKERSAYFARYEEDAIVEATQYMASEPQ